MYIVVEMTNYYGNLIRFIEHIDHRSVTSEKRGNVLFTGTAKECHEYLDRA